MRIQKTYWIEPEKDAKLIGQIQQYGQDRLGEVTGVNGPTISRWLHCGIGMRQDWYNKIIRRVCQVRWNGEVRKLEALVESFHTTKRMVVGVE